MNNLRRFSFVFATLTSVVAPIGCNSDAPPSAVVDVVPTPPQVTVSPSTVENPTERSLDQDVKQASGEVKHEVGTVKGDVIQTVDGVKAEAQDQADRVESGVKKATQDAKDKARDAKNGVKKAAKETKAEVERRLKEAEETAKKSAEGVIDNLLGNPK